MISKPLNHLPRFESIHHTTITIPKHVDQAAVLIFNTLTEKGKTFYANFGSWALIESRFSADGWYEATAVNEVGDSVYLKAIMMAGATQLGQENVWRMVEKTCEGWQGFTIRSWIVA